jgi:hypothetical protein
MMASPARGTLVVAYSSSRKLTMRSEAACIAQGRPAVAWSSGGS